MKKTIFEQMGGTYIRQGDYFLPCLSQKRRSFRYNLGQVVVD